MKNKYIEKYLINLLQELNLEYFIEYMSIQMNYVTKNKDKINLEACKILLNKFSKK